MRRTITLTLAAVVLGLTAWTVRSAAVESPDATGASAPHRHQATAATADTSPSLAGQLAAARLATARYATNLRAAKADGYQIITRMIPDMGYHFLNPTVQGFDVTKPPILVYVRHGRTWQLVALEWVFAEQPTTPPLPGATYGSFDPACHYRDGTFTVALTQDQCPTRSPQTGARFNFWHPRLVTLHVWIWYPNPDGLYSGTNPLMRPFNPPPLSPPAATRGGRP